MGKKLLLVGWEGADWKILHPLIDSGRMPALRGLVENGASGLLLSGQPLIPAAQWTSLVTGKRPWQHHVCHQFQWDEQTQRRIPIPSAHRTAATLWDMLGREGKKSLMVGWPATHDARGERAHIVSNRYAEPTAGPGVKPWPPAIAGTYWPTELGASLDALRVSPEDIQADVISRYVPDWQSLDQKRDRRLAHLRVFLATDFSHHAAMMRLLSNNDWDFAAVHFPALGAISAMFLPYRAPRRDWVSPAEFQMYQQVIDAACVMLDRILGTLVQAAGPDSVVVLASAHGIQQLLPPQYLRAPDNEIWKTPYGVLTLCGPGLCPDALILGATIRDVAPTILTWFGLPIGEDMEGRVLLETFTTLPEVARVASWEGPVEPASAGITPASHAASATPQARQFSLECEWNLALSYLDAARYDEVLPLLEKLFRSFPERVEFGHALFQCQLTVKKTAEAVDTLAILLESIPPGVGSLLLRLDLLLAQRKWQEARLVLDEVQKLKPSDAEALRRLGMSLWRLREWRALGELAREALQRDENEPLAWLGLAESSLRLNRPAEAVEAAKRAIGLNYFQPQAHLILARALLSQGKWAEGREAIQTVMKLQPNHRVAEAYSRRAGLAQGGSSGA